MFINRVRSERDRLGVLECDTLTVVEQSALLPNIQHFDLADRNASFQERGRVYIDAEAAAVELGHAHRNQRPQPRDSTENFSGRSFHKETRLAERLWRCAPRATRSRVRLHICGVDSKRMARDTTDRHLPVWEKILMIERGLGNRRDQLGDV